jgi:hypothetical protein
MAKHEVCINMAVDDPARSTAFFGKLGMPSEPKFSDAKAACIVLGDGVYAMLLQRDFFQSFTARRICDTATHPETIHALSCESREAVDVMVRNAVAAGGSKAIEPKDHGFMYLASFYDLDGHHWEPFWMEQPAKPIA